MSSCVAALEVRHGKLAQVPLAPRLTRKLSVVYPKERFHSRLIEGFVQFAKQRLAALQAADNPGSRAA
jgi:DNA-binding transcriptional LysR family regulator